MEKQLPLIRIGHPCYWGANAYASHCTYRAALSDLLKRGAKMIDAQKALQSALNGSHATCIVHQGYAITECVADKAMQQRHYISKQPAKVRQYLQSQLAQG